MRVVERTFLSTLSDSTLISPEPSVPSAYEAFAPPPDLAPYVERIHLGYELVPVDAPIEERVLPDGAVHLVFNIGDPPGVIGVPDPPAHGAEVLGATSAPAVIRMVGHVEQVGVRLRPRGVAALLGAPAVEMTNRTVSLDLLWGAAAREARERLAEAPRGRARAVVLEDVLRRRLRFADAPATHALATAAQARIARAGGRLTVRQLAQSVGVGERRLEQVFRQHVGLTPKTACRLARFHAAMAIARGEPSRSWSEIAYRAGFADQAHLVRELRAMSGLTPSELRARFAFVQAPLAPAP